MSPTPLLSHRGPGPANELGFSIAQGVNWSNYLKYRPIYPSSFFERIFTYHAQKPSAIWSLAHDISAGCGIVSATLASRFNAVAVSDPNDGYVALARKILMEESCISESKFRFLQEGAEESSVETGTADLVAACECIHWTDVDAAIKEFGRELKAGGTLAVTYYTKPKFVDNDRAQKAWQALWDAFSERCIDDWIDRAFRVGNSGLDNLGFPTEEWRESSGRISILQEEFRHSQWMSESAKARSQRGRRRFGKRMMLTGMICKGSTGLKGTLLPGCLVSQRRTFLSSGVS